VVGRRKYDQGCAVAHALDLVGERWALLVVRELVLGPKRFTDLASGLPGASPDVLTQRLKELTAAGVTRRRRLPAPAASWVYELTGWGAELAPVLVGLARWSSRSPDMPYDAPLSTDSLMLSLMALFDPSADPGFEAVVDVDLGQQRFRLTVADGRLAVSRDARSRDGVEARDGVESRDGVEARDGVARDRRPVDAVLDTDQDTLLALLRTDAPLADAVDSGALRLSGNPAVVERFRHLFPLPEPVPAAEPA
jgi:DNA-binding HxlR family transcriptional regulator